MSCSSESLARLIAAFHCDGLPCPDCVSTLSTEIIADLAELRERLELIDQSKSVNRQTGTEYTIQLSDQNNIVEMENASDNTLIVPDDSTIAFPLGANLYATQTGAGTTMFKAAAGVTLNGVVAGEWNPVSQDHEVLLYKKGANEWIGIPLVAVAADKFIFTIDTELLVNAETGSGDFKVGTVLGATYNAVVDWGDGNEDTINTWNDVRWTHTYDVPGTYTISIGGQFGAIRYVDPFNGDSNKITSVVQWGDVGFEALESGFKGAANITSIPDGPITGAAAVTTLHQMFFRSSLSSVPSDFFAQVTSVTSIQSMFQASNLAAIPNGLFDPLTACQDFSGVFNGTPVVAIPSALFAFNSAATTFAGAFLDTDVTTVPNGLFANKQNVASGGFNQTFEGCASLDTIGSNLWDESLGVTAFVSTFKNCGVLSSVDSAIFQFNTAVVDFNGLFEGSTVPTTDYSNLLINLEANNPNDGEELFFPGSGAFAYIDLHGGSSTYNAGAATARSNLVARLWQITDGGAA